MSSQFLRERERALEEAFFTKREHELLERLRAERDRERQMNELAATCGVTDRKILGSLLDLGIGPETVAALALVPLVAVAWAEGTCGLAERGAVLDAAHDAGVDRGQPGHALLADWLAVRPPHQLFKTWLDFARELRGHLDEEQRAALRADFVGRARAVAKAAGGVLNIGPHVSKEERRVLEEIEAAF